MSDQPDSAAVTLLRRLDAMIDRIAADTADLKQQVARLEGQYASIVRSLDRIEDRLARIERRLEGK